MCETYLGPGTVNIAVVEEKERFVGRGRGTHVAEDDAVNCKAVSMIEFEKEYGDILCACGSPSSMETISGNLSKP